MSCGFHFSRHFMYLNGISANSPAPLVLQSQRRWLPLKEMVAQVHVYGLLLRKITLSQMCLCPLQLHTLSAVITHCPKDFKSIETLSWSIDERVLPPETSWNIDYLFKQKHFQGQRSQSSHRDGMLRKPLLHYPCKFTFTIILVSTENTHNTIFNLTKLYDETDLSCW